MTIKLNENNYVIGYSTGNTMEGIEYDKEVDENFYENSRYFYLDKDILIFDSNLYNEDIAKQKEQTEKYKEITEINTWFVEYDKQVIQYQRAIALEEEYDKDIMELHKEAKEKAIRLKELQS